MSASPFGVDHDPAMIERYQAMGVEHLVLLHASHDAEYLQQLRTDLADRYPDFVHQL